MLISMQIASFAGEDLQLLPGQLDRLETQIIGEVKSEGDCKRPRKSEQKPWPGRGDTAKQAGSYGEDLDDMMIRIGVVLHFSNKTQVLNSLTFNSPTQSSHD